MTLDQLIADYRERNARSLQLFQRAQGSLPGGNTRSGVYVDPFPIYADRGDGVHVTDVDGNRRLDFVDNATALILGHVHPAAVAALERAVRLLEGVKEALAVMPAELAA